MEQYFQHSYPLELLGRMYSMNGLTNYKREAKFSPKQGSYYIESSVRDGKTLTTALQIKKPAQLHLNTLSLSSPFRNEQLELRMRELVFDIDITDYERYCHCLDENSTKKICSKCWQHLEGASLILEYLLKVHWGIPEEHILWLLSGLKGIHCIVNDERFLKKTRKERLFLFSSLNKFSDPELIDFATNVLLPRQDGFPELLLAQFEERSVLKRNLMHSDKFQTACLSLLSREYPSLRKATELAWFNLRGGTSLKIWLALRKLEKGQFPAERPPPSLIIALKCYWPKIDKGPFAVKNHLFKAPFSIHHESRKVSLPVERSDIVKDSLPEGFPTLTEVNLYYMKHGEVIPSLQKGKEIFGKWLDFYPSFD